MNHAPVVTIHQAVDQIQGLFAAHGFSRLVLQRMDGIEYPASAVLTSPPSDMPIRLAVIMDSMNNFELLLWLPDSVDPGAMLNDYDLHLRLIQPQHAFLYGVSAILNYLQSEPD